MPSEFIEPLPQIDNPKKQATLKDVQESLIEGNDFIVNAFDAFSAQNMEINDTLIVVVSELKVISKLLSDMLKRQMLSGISGLEKRVDNKKKKGFKPLALNSEIEAIMQLFAVPIALIVAFLVSFKKALNTNLKSLLKIVMSPFVFIANQFRNLKKRLKKLIPDKIKNMWQTMKAMIPSGKFLVMLLKPFTWVISIITRGFQTALIAFQPLIKFARGLGTLLGKLLWPLQVILGLDAVITDWMSTEGESLPTRIFSAFKALFNTIVSAPVDMIINAVAWVLEKMGLVKIADILKDFSFKDTWTKGADALFKLIGDMFDGLIDFFKDFSIADTFESIKETFFGIVDGVKDKVSKLFTAIVSKMTNFNLPDLGAWVKEKLMGLIESLKTVFTTILEALNPIKGLKKIGGFFGFGEDADENSANSQIVKRARRFFGFGDDDENSVNSNPYKNNGSTGSGGAPTQTLIPVMVQLIPLALFANKEIKKLMEIRDKTNNVQSQPPVIIQNTGVSTTSNNTSIFQSMGDIIPKRSPIEQ